MELDDPLLHERIVEAVQDAEARSSVEVVVAMSARSDAYRAEAYLVGWAVSFTFLMVAVFSPWAMSEVVVMVALVFLAGASARLAGMDDDLLAKLASEVRKDAACQQRARAVFFDEAVTGTRDRTGVLFFYSQLEDRIVVLADGGVLGKVGELPLHEVAQGFRADPWRPLSDRFSDAIRSLGDKLQEALPRPEDDTNELPDPPRVLSPPL